MKKLTCILSIFILLIGIWSCSDSAEHATETPQDYKLTIVDSVQVDILARFLTIVDVQAKTGNLLVIQGMEAKAHVISPGGEVLSTMERPKDDPQAVGRIVSGTFFEDGIALAGRFLIKTYDMEFNLRKSLKPGYPPTGLIYIGTKHLFELPAEGGSKLLSYVGTPQTDLPVTKEEFYEEFNIFDLVDPTLVDSTSAAFTKEQSQEVFKPLGVIPPDSRYLQGRAFYKMRAIFDVKDQSVHYAFSTDTTLYELSLSNGNIVNEYTIPFDEFILFSGYTMGPKGISEQYQRRPEGLAGKIDHIYSVNDLMIVVYTSGLSSKKLEELDFSSPDYYQKLRKVDKKKVLILKDGIRVNTDMTFPEKIQSAFMTDNEGFIWGSQNIGLLEEEPELITFYKMQVVPVD